MNLELVKFEINNLNKHLQEELVLSDFVRAYQFNFIKEDNSCSSFTIFYNYMIDIYMDESEKKYNLSFDILSPSTNTGEYYDFTFSKRKKYTKQNKIKIFIDNGEVELKKLSRLFLIDDIDNIIKNLKETIIKDRHESLSLFKSLGITYEGESFENTPQDYIEEDFKKFSTFLDSSFTAFKSVFKKELVEYEAIYLKHNLNPNIGKNSTKKNKI